jgi:hypothetical protein
MNLLKHLRRKVIGLPTAEHDALLDKLHDLDIREDWTANTMGTVVGVSPAEGVERILALRDSKAEVMDALGWKSRAARLREDTAMRRSWGPL